MQIFTLQSRFIEDQELRSGADLGEMMLHMAKPAQQFGLGTRTRPISDMPFRSFGQAKKALMSAFNPTSGSAQEVLVKHDMDFDRCYIP